MHSVTPTTSVSSAASSSSSFGWSQDKGSARTFRPRTAGVLRVTEGRAWATLNPSPWSPQPRWCPVLDAGDFFVGPGADLALQADQAVVIESWPAGTGTCTCLVWEAAAPSARAGYWQQAVRQPARELGQGLAQVARALAHVLIGLAGYAKQLLAGQGNRAQRCVESSAR